jgi:hypothetical protein
MSLIIDTVSTHLPPKRKATPSGWISFNAVCCHHNGDTADRRQRGGVMFTEGVSYHCFNCGFKASWQPGRSLSAKFKKLMKWLNVSDDVINKCALESLRTAEDTVQHTAVQVPVFIDKPLPRGSRPITQWLEQQPVPEALIPVLEYLYSRHFTVDDYQWHWTDEQGFDNRLIIPFYHQSRIVGYTARYIGHRKTAKYISEQQPGYVFNLDHQQDWQREFVLVVEGPLDAIMVDAVAVTSNELSDAQILQINQLHREVVVVPDRNAAGSKLVDQAIELGWTVSMPPWPQGVVDINDAVKALDRLTVLKMIADHRLATALKIQLSARTWFKNIAADNNSNI